MIRVIPKGFTYPEITRDRCLAFTRKGDEAYYSPRAPAAAPGSDGYPARSLSGANWLPNFEGIDRMTMFIAGNPGAGKSYFAKEMIKLFPTSYKILLFTGLEEGDGNFDELAKVPDRLFKVRMTPENLTTFSLDEIRTRTKATFDATKKEGKDEKCGIILLFDDVDKITDKQVARLTFGIMEDALANGRGHEKHDGKGDIHVLCTSHALNDYRKTKYTLENSGYVVLFPGSTTRRQMFTMFEKIGLAKDLCDQLIAMGKRGDIRSIIVHKVAPMYIIFGPYIMLI